MDTYFILSLIFTVFVLFTIPVYVLLIFLLFTKRAELKSVFYRIYAIGGLVDLIAIVNNYLGTFLPSHGLFIDVYLWLGPTAGQVSIAIAWAGRICQGTTSTLLALNRATAIIVPLKYPNIWSLEKTTVIYLIQLIPGFLSGCALFFTKMKLVKETDSGYYTEFIDEHFRVLYYAYGFGVDTLFVIIIIICYILMIFVHHFRSHSKSQLNSKLVKNNMKREMEFFGIAISICFLEICYFIFLIYFFVLNTNFDTETFYFFYNLLQDSYSCLPSYLLIGFSPIIRRLLLEKLGYKNVKMRKTITVRPSTTTATH